MPVSDSANTTTIPTFTVVVNGTSPEWFYCGQAKHCQMGMVFAINPTEEKSLEGYKANCANATQNIVPGPPGSAPAPPPSPGSQLPTQPSLPTASQSTGSTSLPVQTGSMASSVSRSGSWALVGLAGCLTIMMML